MREVCALRHLSINTEKSYIHWLGRYGPAATRVAPHRCGGAFMKAGRISNS